MKIEQVKISDLILNENNPRVNDKAAEKLKKGIEAYGFINPVIVNKKNNLVLAGHTRIKAQAKLDSDTVPVIFVDMDDATAKGFSIWDNKSAEFSEWDDDLLQDELKELSEMDFDIELTGFDADDFDFEEKKGLTDEDEIPEVPETPVCKLGDLWILGEHRLLCGDSTDIKQVERLMDGEKADMVFTDPPYGMDLDTDYSKMPGTSTKYKKVIADDKKFNASILFEVIECSKWCLWGADYYFNTIPNFFNGSTAVWAKRQSQEETKVFGSAFELCWFYPKRKKTIFFERAINQNSERLGEHPTQKPTALIIKGMECLYGDEKNINVIDLFLGSGSTLIACEKTNRKCFGMELDPHYCDVILQRWSDYTGKDPVREDGVKFSELKNG